MRNKKILGVALFMMVFFMTGCNQDNQSKKSQSDKDDVHQSIGKFTEEDAKRREELKQSIGAAKNLLVDLKKYQEQAEKMASDNTSEDIQDSFDEAVKKGKEGIEAAESELKKAEEELAELNKKRRKCKIKN